MKSYMDDSTVARISFSAVLYRLGLDSDLDDDTFNRIAKLVVRSTNASASLVSLTIDGYQYIVGRVGLGEHFTERYLSRRNNPFCGQVLATNAPFVVNDTRLQPTLHRNDVVSQLHMQAYLGVPLTTAEGRVLGTLCLLNDTPREWTNTDTETLTDIAALVVSEVERREQRFERAQAETNLRHSEQQFAAVFHASPVAIAVCSLHEKRIRDANEQFLHMYGYSRETAIGYTLDELDVQHLLFWRNEHTASIEEGNPVRDLEIHFHTRHGETRDALVSLERIEFNGEPCMLVMLYDITTHKEVEARLINDSLHDPLTGLANRSLFISLLGHAVATTHADPTYQFAVLFLDLDQFKIINDSLGHINGDHLLIEVAQRLKATVTPSAVVARLGGDEFAVLLDTITSAEEAIFAAECIQQAFALPFALIGHEVFTSASIGIALSSAGYKLAEDVLRDADTALYRSKTIGRARYCLFDNAMHEQVMATLQMETDLRHAIERNEFEVYYQPIVSLATGRLSGFEALVRWCHPQYGMVNPMRFIPVAEESGLIVQIDRWVLRESCRQMREWQDQHQPSEELTINVNLSGRQFTQAGLIELIESVLSETQLDPRQLKLEITESVIVDHTELAQHTLMQLRDLHIHVCMDDFGTGYSSLSYLHRFPISTLKIDRSFVNQVGANGENSEILGAIAMLAQHLDIEVVAEGVETAAQFRHLRTLNCAYGQGYFFSKPLDRTRAGAVIASAPKW